MRDNSFTGLIVAGSLGTIFGGALLYFSGFIESQFEAGAKAERERALQLYLDTPDEEKGGVWYYSNLPTTEYQISQATEKSKFRGPILYSSHVAYSRYFAEQYGYPDDYVSDELPEFVDFMVFDTKYAGRFERCKMKLLIDKDGPVRIPDKNLFQPFSGSSLNMMRAAQPQRLSGFSEQQYQQEYRLNSSQYDSSKSIRQAIHGTFALAGLPKAANIRGNGTFFTVDIEVLNNNLFAEWSYVELATHCSPLTQNLFSRDEVWLVARPKDAPDNLWLDPRSTSEMINIKVPSRLQQSLNAELSKLNFELE